MMITTIFLATALWHLLAAYHFTFFPGRTLARISRERPVNPVAIEAVRFLGAINFAFVSLGVGGCLLDPQQQWPVSLTLMVANLSQALVDASVKRRGLAGGPFFAQIFWGDVLFTLLNALCLGFFVLDAFATTRAWC